jgi:glycosyltransferase involved in cell wall biosynthesis
MNWDNITPLVLTFNEEPNLRRCLERLNWAQRVVVLDSGSTDGTEAIAAEFANVEFLTRPFDDHTRQWNHGLDQARTPWVLTLDADYVLGVGFEDELMMLPEDPACDAFFATFRYLVFGRPLRACLYPPRAVLFRPGRCHYVQDGHTQLLHVEGAEKHLDTKIDHDDRKPLTRWFISQDKYAKLEAEKLLSLPTAELSLQDRIRRTMILGPVLVFFYTLLLRGTILDGWHGWFYTLQRTVAEMMLSLRLLEKQLAADSRT